MPYFSIIIPSYNRAKYIAKAIESLLSQTFTDWELIIIDDASTDDTKAIVDSFNDPRILYVKNTVNQERCISRNIGIGHAQSEYICFLDSDDYHLDCHLEKMYQFIQTKTDKKAFFFANAWNESAAGFRTERACPNFEEHNPYTYFLHYTVNPQRWVVHRSVFEHVKFDADVTICEDMDTSLRIVAAGYPIYQLAEQTTVYVQAVDSFTLSDGNKAEKELFYLKRIFANKALAGKLPLKERNRLLSMCYYHLSIKAFNEHRKSQTLMYALKALVKYPTGYNQNTNKTLAVMVLYSLPVVGSVLKKIKHILSAQVNKMA
jgi:glycosyltransferase involved in cell wall biosynthesis